MDFVKQTQYNSKNYGIYKFIYNSFCITKIADLPTLSARHGV